MNNASSFRRSTSLLDSVSTNFIALARIEIVVLNLRTMLNLAKLRRRRAA